MSLYALRPRRIRANSTLREMVRQFEVKPENLVYPIFVAEGIEQPVNIQSMPGQKQWPEQHVHEPVLKAFEVGVKSFIIFGVPQAKDIDAAGAYSEESIVCKALKTLKKHCPEAFLITDLCLCAYKQDGHCGFSDDSERMLDKKTAQALAKMAVAHCKAGADMVAPSDMMDGRIGVIRQSLNKSGFEHIPIMSYSAKYASAFYGPFREAAGSAPGRGDRKAYQMDPANSRDAIIQMKADLEQGADIIMVKPAMSYLDIISRAKNQIDCVLAAYHVSGEYAMIKAAAKNGWIDEKAIAMETLLSIKRAGADVIITYYAPEAAKWIRETK